jgi:hypothetical protein
VVTSLNVDVRISLNLSSFMTIAAMITPVINQPSNLGPLNYVALFKVESLRE